MTRFATVIFGATVMALAAAVPARAADLTLDDCIELALKHRAAIIAARGAEDLAKASERAALGAFLPQASATYEYAKTKDRDRKLEVQTDTGTIKSSLPNIDYYNKSTNISASIGFPLPQTLHSYLAARVDHERASLDVIASEQDLIYAVKSSFYAYLAAVQNVSVQEEAVKRSDEQLKLIQSKFDLGSAAKSDVLKQKVQSGNDVLSLLRARNAVTSTMAALAYTVGLDPRQEWSFATQYIVRQYDGSLTDAIEFGMNRRPSVLSSQKSVKASDHRLTVAKLQYLPKFSPYASYGYSKSTGINPFDYSARTSSLTSLTYGFQVSWNIFDGFAREEGFTSARVARNNARAALADQRNLVASEIKTAYLDIDRLKEQKKVSDENVAAATEDLKITQEKYNLGAATILDLLNAQVSLKEAQVSSISADFDLNLAVAKLENAMGKM
ncbi:MAG: TolC family protein [Candidatus Zixiibacteriota bacterium]